MTQTLRKIIDPHLHFFNVTKGDYNWLKPENPPFWSDKQSIYKSFVEADTELDVPNELVGFVHIEAGFDNLQPWREIDWLQQHCTLPFRSVAFADITAPTFTEHVQLLKQRKSVVGIRHVLDELAAQILSSDLIQQHFSLLSQAELSFDAQLSLIDEPAIERLIGLATEHKTVRIVINHAGRPPANEDIQQRQKWQANLQKLANYKNIAIKLSGWEMSNRTWQAQQIISVIQSCIATLGDSRVMLASNFPLCLFTMPYAELWRTYTAMQQISPQTLEKITYCNAKNWYKF